MNANKKERAHAAFDRAREICKTDKKAVRVTQEDASQDYFEKTKWALSHRVIKDRRQ